MSKRVKKQVKNMLESRGYEVKTRKDDWIVGTKKTEKGKKEKLMAKYIDEEGSVGVAIVRDMVKVLKKDKATKGILVSDSAFTSYAKKEAKKANIDLFNADRLKISMLDHEMIPKHEILSTNDTKKVLENYNIIKEQLPKIKLQDPVVRLIGAKMGQVLRITRKSPTAERATYYRLVVQ